MATVPQSATPLEVSFELQPDRTVFAGPPAEPTPLPEIIAALRTIVQLEGLSDEEYIWLATHCTERVGPDGAVVFREGEPASRLNFILHGEVHVRRRHTGPMALLDRKSVV